MVSRMQLGWAAVRGEPDFQLIGPEFVDRSLGGKMVVLEAHFTSADHPPSACSDSRHIPGSIQVHPSYLEAGTDRSKYYPLYECPADGNLLPDTELVRALEHLGITPDSPVVVAGSEPDGTMAAARLVWALLYAGVGRIYLLDGGLAAWRAYGGETTSEIKVAGDMEGFGRQLFQPHSAWIMRPEFLATTAEVRSISHSNRPTTGKLIDVRGGGEWDGTETQHYPFFSKAGHIPSAKYQGDWDNLVDPETHMLAPMLDAVAQRWREQGIIDCEVAAGRKPLIFYCGTGWRSSIALLVALLLGLRAKNYDDGFFGWSWSGENEIEVARMS